MRFQLMDAILLELMPMEHAQHQSRAINVKTVVLVGVNLSTVLPIPYTDMIKDLLCAMLAAVGFVLIWILAAII